MEIFIVIIFLILIILYYLYARIIRNKNNVFEALSGIDVQLKNRSNLIPNVLTIAKKFMKQLMDHKMLTVKAEENVIRLFPPLVVSNIELDEGINKIEAVCKEMS